MASVPRSANAVAYFPRRLVVTDGSDMSDDLMAWNEWTEDETLLTWTQRLHRRI